MSVESGLLTMQRASSERGEGKAKLAVDYAGEPMTIGITRTFFLDAVRVVETEDVAIKFSDPGSPIMVESNGYRSVIAPCQLK
jgi:DNA polymerase-3 subunit beta